MDIGSDVSVIVDEYKITVGFFSLFKNRAKNSNVIFCGLIT